MSNMLELCFIGKTINCNDCHKTWYKKEKGFKRLTELSYVEQQLLLWRCGLDTDNLDDMTSPDNKVCFYHYCKYISCYESKQKNCSNPFNIHIKTKKTKQYQQGQYAITLKLANLLKGKLQLIPSQKLCRECWKKVTTISISLSSPQYFSSLSENGNSSASLSSYEDDIISLDNSLTACGVSPFKSFGKSKQQKLNHVNKKME